MKSFNLLIKLMLLVFAFGIVSCSGSQDTGLTPTDSSELTISGTLENIYGYPVGGAEVVLEQGGVVQASDVTDADGRYSFSVVPGDYELKIDGVGYLSKTVPISVMSEDPIPTQYISVDFNTHGTILGKVTDTDQDGVPLHQVKVAADDDNYVQTSSTGFFSITAPHGAVDLEFSKEAYGTVTSSHELSFEVPYLRGDAVLSIDTSTHGVVSGVASMEFGDGTTAAPVQTYPYVGSDVRYRKAGKLVGKITIVNDDGSYRIVLPHDDLYDIRGVSVYHHNYVGDEFTLDSNNAFVDESYTLQLKTDDYGGVYGQAVDQFDRPLEGVNVTFNDGDSLLGSVVSDELGNFYAILDLGIYDVEFTKDGFENTIETADLDNEAFVYLPSLVLNYTSSDLYTLSGVITNGHGVAIEDASVEVYSGTTLLKGDVTDSSGAYSFSLTNGTYSLNVTAAAHEIIIGHEVVMDDADLTLNFTLNGANLSAYQHVLHIDDTGDLWAWGLNQYGQLGDNSTVPMHRPKNISGLYPGLDKFSMVSAESAHSLGLDVNSKLYAWGSNYYGQLGDGTTTDSLVPVEVDLSNLPAGEKVVKISTGPYVSALITDKGTLLMWGYGHFNQLGSPDTDDILKPTVVPLANVQNAVVSFHATVALTKDGDVYAWGSNTYGGLGIGDMDSSMKTHIPQLLPNLKAVEISAGDHHILVLTNQGDLYGWGRNHADQIDDTGVNQYAPKHIMSNVKTISAGPMTNYVILGDDTVTYWGSGGPYDLSSLSDVVEVEGGSASGLAMTSDGRIYAWGYNYIGGGVDNLIPMEVKIIKGGNVSSGSATLYRNDDYELYSWGYNNDGQVGDGTTVDVLYPKKISSDRFDLISTGYNTSFAYDIHHQLWGWGSNSYGQLGDNSTVDRSSPVLVDMSDVSGNVRLIEISSSAYHTAAIGSDRNLYTWGRSNYGQTGHSSDKLIPTFYFRTKYRAVATTTYTTIALRADGIIRIVGRNAYGLWGTGESDTDAQSSVVIILTPGSDFDGEVLEIAGGESHVLALTDNGTLYGWGNNGSKQLDSSSNAYYIAPHKLMENVRTMDAGLYSSYAVKLDGTVHSWGSNANNALGNLSLLNDKDILLISGGASGGKAISRDGKVYSWGDNFTTGTGYSSADPVDITDSLK